ncbi:MAG TPA: carotenoid oxygenase family protein [Xanthomonadaceae bacterium]|nr:carotenoid oxygenase family protein [Xanthomonadaceae bacterium]
MDRRRFLRSFLGSTAALAFAPGLLRAEVAYASDAARFADGLAQRPWLSGWKTVGTESLGPTVAAVEGRLPKELAGALYRNGPAWFDRDGFRYKHWFDGDGMIHAWRIGGGSIEHRARMVATPKFVREQHEARFLVPAAGTTVPNPVPVRNNDDVNTANTAVIRFDGRLYALWEGGSATELEPESLRTLGPVTWREDLVAAPFSAHPLVDRDGSLWNFGNIAQLGGSGVLVWHIGADGRLIRTAMLPSDAPGYIHGFAMSDRYLVFMLIPYRVPGEGGAYFERLRYTPEQPCRVAVVAKDALDAPRWIDVPFGAVYHFGQAHERGRDLIVQAVRHNDIEEMRSPMAGAMRGEPDAGLADTELVALRIDLASGRARWESSGMRELEFPVFDPRAPDGRPTRLYAPTNAGAASAPYFNAIAAIDPDTGRRDMHRYGSDVMAEEHVFVPKPGSHKPGQGWLVGTLLDHGRGRSGIAVLDAERVADGPLAQAWLPYTVPLGFHGWFAGSG